MSFFKALVDNSTDVISLVEQTGVMLFVSAASTKVLGYTPEELTGQVVYDLLHTDDRDTFRRALRASLARSAEPHQPEVRIRHKDGQWCWVESTLSNLVLDLQVESAVINWRDISLRRAVREEKQEESQDMARSNAELEHFAYAVAHDLREPLRTISMFTELLLAEGHVDPAGRELAQYVGEGVTRVSGLFESLHTFAVRGFDHLPSSLDLEPVVSQALLNVGHAVQASGATMIIDPLPWVQGNHQQLLRVFQNLFINAIKYQGSDPPRIHVTSEQLGAEWLIKVKDNGIGIAPQDHERIFRLLKRVPGGGSSGAGFGLAICKKIVEELGGGSGWSLNWARVPPFASRSRRCVRNRQTPAWSPRSC